MGGGEVRGGPLFLGTTTLDSLEELPKRKKKKQKPWSYSSLLSQMKKTPGGGKRERSIGGVSFTTSWKGFLQP